MTTLAGPKLHVQSGDVRSPVGEVALTAGTLAANYDFHLGACAQEHSAGLFVHGTSGNTPASANW
jgi:hypothetical protein